ncbi:MAG: hypothetical protein KF895_10355 [Parvibaculum sp.]|nr:hypothetical protein [Parvibaculum sp.]
METLPPAAKPRRASCGAAALTQLKVELYQALRAEGKPRRSPARDEGPPPADHPRLLKFNVPILFFLAMDFLTY